MMKAKKSCLTFSADTAEKIEQLKEHLEQANGIKLSRAQTVAYAVAFVEKTNFTKSVEA